MTRSDDLRNEAAALEAQAAQLDTPLSQADVHTMYQARQYGQIEQARKDGRLDAILNPATKGA